MSRISIDVTQQEHQRLKAMAALQGKSIKDFVLARTLGVLEENESLAELEALLEGRIHEAKTEGTSKRSVGGIFQQAREEANPDLDA